MAAQAMAVTQAMAAALAALAEEVADAADAAETAEGQAGRDVVRVSAAEGETVEKEATPTIWIRIPQSFIGTLEPA